MKIQKRNNFLFKDRLKESLMQIDQMILPKELYGAQLECFYIGISDILKSYLLTKFYFNAIKIK